VFIGDTVSDRMLGEGGDDIMVGNGGRGDRYMGGSGFDWAGFQHASLAADADLLLRAFDETPVVPSAASVLARYESIEGLSGSAHSDILRGDDANAAAIAVSGFTGSRLTNIGLIAGLQDVLGAGVTSFDSGNIILGGNGSDIIEGRGGNDLIDGDKALHVRISVRANADGTGAELRTANSMSELVEDVFSGAINPGQLQIVREIRNGDGSFNFDTAVFSGRRAEYDVEGFQAIGGVEAADLNGDGYITVTHLDPGDPTGATIGVDGIDRIARIERMQFSDQSVVLVQGLNAEPTGLVTINDTTPEVGTVITASMAGVTDGDNPGGVITGPIAYFWQIDLRGLGVFEDIIIATGVGEERVTGPNLTVTPDLAGFALRVRAVYQDAHGVIETVFSAPTALTSAVLINDAPIGSPTAVLAAGTEDVAYVVSAASLLQGFSDLEGNTPLTITGLSASAGTVVNNGNGTYTITPGLNFNGLMELSYSVVDSLGASTAALQSFTVTAVNDAPTGSATATLAAGTEDAAYVVSAAALLQGFSDVDGDTLSVSGLAASSGSVVDNGNGTFTITPAANVNGPVSLSYNVVDGNTGSVAATQSFSLAAVNDAPTGGVTIDDATPSLNQTLTASNDLADVDGLGAIGYQWQSLVAGIWTNIPGATASSFTTTLAQANQQLRVQASYLDGDGTTETVTSGATAPVFPFNVITGSGTLNGTPLPDLITGSATNDVLNGLGANDSLIGGAGNDTLDGGAGVDTMVGGADNDTYVVDVSGDVIVEIVGAGTDTVLSSAASYAMSANVENLTQVAALAINVTGNNMNNLITGNTGADFLFGGNGNDTLSGGGGNDTLVGSNDNDLLDGGTGVDQLSGGAGDDTYVVDVTGDVINELVAGGTDTVLSSAASYAMSSNVENLTQIAALAINVTGNNMNNVITGNIGNDSLFGGTGTDTLNGGAGNDTLNGGTGADSMTGGADNDRYLVDDAGDIVVELAGGGTDTVQTVLSAYSLGTDVENLFYAGAGSFAGTGNTLGNVITTQGGNDTLDGGLGNDTLGGGAGNDTYIVDSATDVIVEIVGAGTDTVLSSAASYAMSANVENLTQVAALAINVTGNNMNNLITGNTGADFLFGGNGNDTLDGGAGSDTLTGSAGEDRFVFGPASGNDWVQDFDANPVAGQDLLDISGLGVTAATFAASVTIDDIGTDTLVTIGTDTIRLIGVGNATTITIDDFVLFV
jgi:Ca2+-binding RTX toxin-like protein